MRSDMEDIPEESETPENLICCFLDRGDAGEQIIKMLAEFGFEITKAAPPVPAPIDEAATLRTKLATARAALEAFLGIPITAPDGTDWWQAAVSLHSSDLRRARKAYEDTAI